MDSKDFKMLLTDLYDIYNPSKNKDIDNLVNSYNGREFDAIKTIIIRYNFKGHPGYNENVNRDEYINFLIKSYSEGNRPMSKESRIEESKRADEEKKKEISLEQQKKEREIEKEKEVILTAGNEVKNAIKNEVDILKNELLNQISHKMTDMDEYFKKKKEEFKRREDLLKEVEKNVINFSGQTFLNTTEDGEDESISVNNTRINIENLNFTDSDVKLPGEEILNQLSKGSKMILFNSEGRVCGVEVKDITYDLVSHDGEPVKEIILQQI